MLNPILVLGLINIYGILSPGLFENTDVVLQNIQPLQNNNAWNSGLVVVPPLDPSHFIWMEKNHTETPFATNKTN